MNHEIIKSKEYIKVYLVSTEYWDYDGGGEDFLAVFSDLELAQNFCSKVLKKIDNEPHNSYKKNHAPQYGKYSWQRKKESLNIKEVNLDDDSILETDYK